MFLYKTFWDLYKTEYFLYKKRRKFQHVFSAFSGFLIRVPDFFAFFFWLFRWESPFLSFTYPFFLKVFFYLVGYDPYVSFPSVCLFLRILLIKNPFFSEWTILPDMHLFSFRLGIFIFFRMLRQIFLSCLASFSAFFRPPAKNNLLFFHPDHPFSEIFSLRRNNFSCLFYVELRKFSVCFHNFFAFLELFWKKNPLFGVSITQFRTCFSWQSGYFSSFFRGGLRNFSARFDIFCASPEFFQRKNPHFPKWIFRPTEYFLLSPEVIFAPSGRNFHLSGSFLHELNARAPARA